MTNNSAAKIHKKHLMKYVNKSRKIVSLVSIHFSDIVIKPKNNKKIKILFITGNGTLDSKSRYYLWKHPFNTNIWAQILDSVADYTITEDLESLNNENLKNYDVIMNNSFFKEPTPSQFNALFSFIENGKSYFGLHASLFSFLNSKKYLEMMAAKFINHKDIKTFKVTTADNWYGYNSLVTKNHPIVNGINDFSTLNKLYIAEGLANNFSVIA